jgi:hypothetical protein
MFNNRTVLPFSLVVAASFTVGCTSKGPTPGDALTEQENVVMAERESAPSGPQALGIPTKKYERDYLKHPHDPHGPAAHLNPPASHVSGDVKIIDLGGLTFEAPEGWRYQHPGMSMRRAEFGVEGDSGTAGLVVYFFGNQGAGSLEANIERWLGQFKNPDGSAITSTRLLERKIAGLDTTQVETVGTYLGGMGSGSPDSAAGRPGQRMIATIVKTPSGPFYFKFLGENQTVVENRKALEGLFESMKATM